MTSRTRVKICGITTPEDAVLAASLGADAIGLVFHPPSPRHVEAATARAICAALPPFVSRVGLFVDAEPGRIQAVLDAVPLDCLQFHGEESPHDCESWGLPYLKAIRMRPDIDIDRAAARFSSACGLLLDTYVPGVPGGTGAAFDWTRVPDHCALPLVLAGGLTPDNVADAIAAARPYAVDVSGGVEAVKGRKDRTKLAAFMQGVARGRH
jgi:phosphoribosylanthranilate isomerase